MKVEIRVFSIDGSEQSRKVFKIPRFTYPQLLAKAEKMFAESEKSFTIEEV